MIQDLQQDHPEASGRALCQIAGVSRSWFYDRPESGERDPGPRDAIEEIVLAFPGYGDRRVTHALARDGWQVNHKRVLRVMREESLLCRLKRGFVPTTDSQHGYRRYPDLIKEMVIDRPDAVWSADMSELYFSAGCNAFIAAFFQGDTTAFDAMCAALAVP